MNDTDDDTVIKNINLVALIKVYKRKCVINIIISGCKWHLNDMSYPPIPASITI